VVARLVHTQKVASSNPAGATTIIGGHVMDARARRLEQLATDVYRLAFDIAEPSRSIERSERLIAEGERIAHEVRAVVRGRG
jgi:hypothetical protein